MTDLHHPGVHAEVLNFLLTSASSEVLVFKQLLLDLPQIGLRGDPLACYMTQANILLVVILRYILLVDLHILQVALHALPVVPLLHRAEGGICG